MRCSQQIFFKPPIFFLKWDSSRNFRPISPKSMYFNIPGHENVSLMIEKLSLVWIDMVGSRWLRFAAHRTTTLTPVAIGYPRIGVVFGSSSKHGRSNLISEITWMKMMNRYLSKQKFVWNEFQIWTFYIYNIQCTNCLCFHLLLVSLKFLCWQTTVALFFGTLDGLKVDHLYEGLSSWVKRNARKLGLKTWKSTYSEVITRSQRLGYVKFHLPCVRSSVIDSVGIPVLRVSRRGSRWRPPLSRPRPLSRRSLISWRWPLSWSSVSRGRPPSWSLWISHRSPFFWIRSPVM